MARKVDTGSEVYMHKDADLRVETELSDNCFSVKFWDRQAGKYATPLICFRYFDPDAGRIAAWKRLAADLAALRVEAEAV